MKRLMMEVLPTDWSPRNTSLYLDRGWMIEPLDWSAIVIIVIDKIQ